jgi:MFS family permease
MRLLPPGTSPDARLLLTSRALRAFGDGFMSLLLPYYLTLLGFSALEVGIMVTATLLGSGLMTLAVGMVAHRYRGRSLLRVASLLMVITGVAVAAASDFWPLLLIAFVGTLNPSGGDVSVFVPLEHSLLAQATAPESRTALFARYSLVGALVAAFGAQAAVIPDVMARFLEMTPIAALQTMFLLYGALGLAAFARYQGLAPGLEIRPEQRPSPLGKSKRTVYTLAALFSLDAFGGGFAVQSLLALWLYDRYGLSVTAAGTIFFWTGILTAFSHLAAAWLASRIGLVNTMVFTHLPSNVFLILVPLMPNLPLALTFLFLRFALGSMDVPARTSYVMAVVSPEERPAAAGITAVPRSLAAAVSPAFAGYLLTLSTFGWPLVICGVLKIVYDLTLLGMFRKVKPPEEQGGRMKDEG